MIRGATLSPDGHFRPNGPVQTTGTVHSSMDTSYRMLGEIENPVSLDGCLFCRRGRAGRLRRRFVSLSFTSGGSIKIFTEIPEAERSHSENSSGANLFRNAYTRLHRSLSYASAMRKMDSLEIYVPCDISWVAKDIENDPCTFEIEIPTTYETMRKLDDLFSEFNNDRDVLSTDAESNDSGYRSRDRHDPVDELRREVQTAQSKNKAFVLQFRCPKGSHEKALWLRALSKIGRLSSQTVRKKSFLSTITAPLKIQNHSRVRRRRASNQVFAQHARDLDMSEAFDDSTRVFTTKNVEKLIRGSNSRYVRDKEYRVLPSYAYPHRWMTRKEMHEEMVLPSETFHDLRVLSCNKKEVGCLRVEVLQCLGLPKLDRTSDTDALVYLVCGSYAFATDVIPNRMNPMWLRKSRRACEFPVFHGYARLYVGVFDSDGKNEKDDFAGRVVVDLARLRPRSSYDVTLPLRLSTHVYSRRKRGAIRLRFTLNWTSERDALLSYIPRKIKLCLPQHSKPNVSVTVQCSDEKAFRNIAITVYGAHLPGRFTFHQMRASIRELNFTRKHIFVGIRNSFRDLRQWQNPAISGFVFFAWMHCVYLNAFSLVPAYACLCFLLFLIRNYVRYGVELPWTNGFIPPSWEEMFSALVFGHDPETKHIEPLSLGHHRDSMTYDPLVDHSTVDGGVEPTVKTHKPKGLAFFDALGFLKEPDIAADDDRVLHLEFPFANDTDYPKFGTRECLVDHTGDLERSGPIQGEDDNRPVENMDEYLTVERRGSIVARFPLDMPNLPDVNIHDIMRKDSSGMKEYDEEENNFTAGKAVVGAGRKAAKTVKKQGRRAAAQIQSAATKTGAKIQTAATEFSGITGLDHVVQPIQKGITTSSARVNHRINEMIALQKTHPLHSPLRRGYSIDDGAVPISTLSTDNRRRRRAYSADESLISYPSAHGQPSSSSRPDHIGSEVSETHSMPSNLSGVTPEMFAEEYDPTLLFPEQNIDVDGPNTGKKLTDDLVDIKDKIHELTYHAFNDQPYVLKSQDTLYFGDSKKPERRRKDVKRKLDKLLNVAQYSHSNPFIARLGLYVEPIIGSLYSFLCLFRAGFNLVTWQDPMFTFILSVVSAALTIILFVFPWRQFLFGLGLLIVGPQNWVVRILREKGHLPPVRKRAQEDADETNIKFQVGQPLFTRKQRIGGNEVQMLADVTVDSREIHHVVVPYRPLMYQRFYDWPPEALYAQVTPDEQGEKERKKKEEKKKKKASGRMRKRRPSILLYRSNSFDSTESGDGPKRRRHKLD